MKKVIGVSLLAAFIGGAAAIGGYKLMEPNTAGLTITEKQNAYFANNPARVSSAGAVDFVQAAAVVSPAVVHIKTIYGGKSSDEEMNGGGDLFEQFFGRGGRGLQRAPQAASGSGVILTADGYIVTNNHVVDKADKIQVVLTDKREVEAKVIGRDPDTDLALLKVNATGLPFVKVGNSDNVQIGEWVLAIGFPLDLQTTVTAGIVSAKARSIGIIGRGKQQEGLTYEEYQEYRRSGKVPERVKPSKGIEAFIQTDAAINPGNSGGALINTNGELIGINSAIASNTGFNEGYGFAIPINLAKKILDDFMKFGVVKRAYVGVNFQPVVAKLADSLNMKDINGLYVNSVVPGSGAQQAGIQSGDVIKKINGVTIYDSPDLQEKIGRLSPGDKVALTIYRNGALKNVNVTLKGEEVTPVKAASTTVASVGALGATFSAVPEGVKSKYGIKGGVMVASVVPGKAFDDNGLAKGVIVTSVNGKVVNSTADVEAALSLSRNGMVLISAIEGNTMYNYRFPLDSYK
ncbi:MAG: PDZ domain-containing protein [Pedobacter sp.]|nr:MAG: PDZ domain-containing protein [Pedobacter sp.]